MVALPPRLRGLYGMWAYPVSVVFFLSSERELVDLFFRPEGPTNAEALDDSVTSGGS